MTDTFESILCDHMARYPLMTPRDAIKLCHQSEFGGGHLIADAAKSLANLVDEAQITAKGGTPLFEPIGGGLARLHIGALEALPTLKTVNGAFVYSAQAVRGTQDGLHNKLTLLESLCAADRTPFQANELAQCLREYRADGCPMTRHSEAFRAAYAPAYRVVLAQFELLWPVLARIDAMLAKQARVVVGIDGRCGSGKTTLATLIQGVYGANLFHMDDFFLRPEQRTPERYAEPGGNVDRERFGREVLTMLQSGEPFSYRPFDCAAMALAEPISVCQARVAIVEGSYSLHPALREAYDVRVFTNIDPAEQSARILKRNGEAAHRRFIAEWIPLEERYFEHCSVVECCDFVL